MIPLSLVVPYDGSASLEPLLASLKDQTVGPAEYEVVVGCEFGTEAIPAGLAAMAGRVKIAHAHSVPRATGHTAAQLRNAAIHMAEGARLVFIDSDCILAPHCLRHHRDAAPDEILCGARSQVLAADLRRTSDPLTYSQARAIAVPDPRARKVPSRGRQPWEDFWSCNASAHRELVADAGYFDEMGYRCHDLDLGYRLSRLGGRFRFDPGCEVIHFEHPRSLWHRQSQLRGLSWLAAKYPEAKPAADNRMTVFRKAFTDTLFACEAKFRSLVAGMPGARAALSWIAPCGSGTELLRNFPADLPVLVRQDSYSTRIFLRLDETCWDYSIVFPKADTAHDPRHSVVVHASIEPGALRRTLSSVFAQSCQSFEVLVAYTDATVVSIREALPFRCLSRLRMLRVPDERENAVTCDALSQACRAASILKLQAGDWLPEDFLPASARMPECGRPQVGRDSSPSAGEPEHLPRAAGPDTPGLLRTLRDAAPYPAEMDPPQARNADNTQFCCVVFEGSLDPVLTHGILDALRNAGQKATFFAAGVRLRDGLSLWRRIVSEGHEVGISGLFHEDLTNCIYGGLEERLLRCTQLVADSLGVRPRWLRPPFGKSNALVEMLAAEAGLYVAAADLSAKDVVRAFNALGAPAELHLRGKIVACREDHGLPGSPVLCARLCTIVNRLGLRSVSLSEALAVSGEAARRFAPWRGA